MDSINLSINILKEINIEPIVELAAAHSDTITAVASVALPIIATTATLYIIYKVLRHYNITPLTTYQTITHLVSQSLGINPDEIFDIESQNPTEVRWIKTPLGYHVTIQSEKQMCRFFFRHSPIHQLTWRSDCKVPSQAHLSFKELPPQFEVPKKVGEMIKTYLEQYAIKSQTSHKTHIPLSIEPARREDYLVKSEMNWVRNAPETAKAVLRGWEPFERVKGHNAFDHKNSEILNQMLRSLVIMYSDEADWNDLNPKHILEQKLRQFCKIKKMQEIHDILFGKKKFADNETVKKSLFEAIGNLIKTPEYKKQLQTFLKTPNATFTGVDKRFPLLYFAHAIARSMYLNVDLNKFQRDLVQGHIVKVFGKFTPPDTNLSKWSDSHLSVVDSSCKRAQSWNDFFYIKSECLKGSAPFLGGILGWVFRTDGKFAPANTNNCIQRLSTEKRGEKEIICLGMPVPTIDTTATTAEVLDHLRLLLDYYKATDQKFFSFMHLKISNAKDGSINWESVEGMRALALKRLAEEYPGTYFYFSLPFDGALFAKPSQVPDIAFDKDLEQFSIERDDSGKYCDKRSLRSCFKHAVLNNKYGWYFPKKFWDDHGAALQEKYHLNPRLSPQEALFETLFDEIKKHFFRLKTALDREEWQVFQVLFGARIIECLSPFSDAFHNTCKDGIDRAAVYLLARRALNLFRNPGKMNPETIAEEVRDMFVDYVKRAISAKQQGPIPHRHEVAAKLLEIIEKAGLLPPEQRYEIQRDLQTALYGAQEADDGCHIFEAGEEELTKWPEQKNRWWV